MDPVSVQPGSSDEQAAEEVAAADVPAPRTGAVDPLVSLVELDFKTKGHRKICLGDLRASIDAGRFVWIDVDVAQQGEARALLGRLDLCMPEIVEDALTREPATQIARYDDYVHLVLSGCRLVGHKFDLERVDAILGESFLLTLHKGQPVFLEAVRKSYLADFRRFAQSPSFLLYELWDHLIDNYLSVHKRFEERVDQLQARLIGDVDDTVFAEASELGVDLLHLRKVVLPARAVLTDLSTRKSPFVSEATQPYLANMVGTIERVLQDVLVDRDILSGALNNYMSLVAHKTNRTMSRLTVVSIIFLPLTFLCGVYGMNFSVLPEKDWEYGYLVFWIAVVVIVVVLLWLMRRKKVL
jgi:magnesium transporter